MGAAPDPDGSLKRRGAGAGALGAGARLPPLLPAPSRVALLRLGPIGRPAAHALLMALSTSMSLTWPPGAVHSVLEKAAGVPLFLVELCRQCATGGSLPAAPGEAFHVPATIQQIALARADQLPPAAQAVLKLLAVVDVGGGFSCERALAADPGGLGLGPGLGPAALRRALRQLRRAGIIAEAASGGSGAAVRVGAPPKNPPDVDSGEDPEDDEDEEREEGAHPEGARWPPLEQPLCFLHALMRSRRALPATWLNEAVYWAIPSDLRREVHGRVARWLEARRPDDSAAIALHWRAAGEPERALGHLGRAGRAAVHANALPEARRLFREKLAALDAVAARGGFARGPVRGRGPAEARVEALRHLALVENYSGHFAAAGEAAEDAAAAIGEPLPASRIGPAAALRGLAIGSVSEGTPPERLRAADCRVRANFSTLLDIVGHTESAAALLAQARDLAEELDSDPGRAAAAMHGGLQACRAGDFPAGARLCGPAPPRSAPDRIYVLICACRFLGAASVASPQPNQHELLATAALPLALTGRLAEARRCCEDAAVFASRLGADAYGAYLPALVGALAAALAGRDEAAAAHLRQAEQGGAESRAWWVREIVRAVRCLLAWRAGRVEAALADAEACAATWRARGPDVDWAAVVLPAILVEFSVWARARAAAALAAAAEEGPRGGARGLVGVDVFVAPAEEAAGALRRAERLAEGVRALAEATCRRRLPCLRPFVELAGAERPGLAPRRRLARLRAAADAFARFGLRPFEAAARLRLARAEPDAAAAAAALAAARRLAAETGARVPALGRPAPPPGEFESTWV
eukprot:tig00000624_g2652.t1